MNFSLLADNLTNPALLFFFLGLISVRLKSDLKIPENSSKFISLYLLFSIGFKGGQELSHSAINSELMWSVFFGVGTAVIIPFYTFFIAKKRLGVENAGAIAAAYGSVSAVTFVTTIAYLESSSIPFDGHMVAVMALMEAPSIIVGLFLLSIYRKNKNSNTSMAAVVKHSITNGSVLMIVGSLVIGFIANENQAEGIKPFTTDIFKGFLAVFLLDMGIQSGKHISSFVQKGWFPFAFSIVVPLFNGVLIALLSGFLLESEGNRLLISILAASASYIAVPAAMKLAAPKATPGLYLPMALAVTFPLNISIGIPVYLYIISIV